MAHSVHAAQPADLVVPADPAADDVDAVPARPRYRRAVPAGLALGALGVALLGGAVPGLAATHAGESSNARPDGARTVALPPIAPTRSAEPDDPDPISDIWGRRPGGPRRGI